MKNCIVLKRITHILLALPLLVTTTGLTVHLHYCGHSLYDIGVFSMADNCCIPDKDMQGKAAHDHCATEVQKTGHCKDETLRVSSVDDFLTSESGTVFRTQTIPLPAFFESYSSGLYPEPNTSHHEEAPEHNNAPPGVAPEPSFLQTFLI